MPEPLPDDASPSVATPDPSRSAASSPGLDPEYANSNRNLATGLAGTSFAILTFALFFLYDRYESGVFNPVLFQVTIADLLAAVFSFGYSGAHFYWLMEETLVHDPRAPAHLRAGDVYFILGLILLMIGPALILFTAELDYLGAFAFALWVGILYLVLRGGRRSH